MAGALQPLDQKFAIVDTRGNPTEYFIRWAQQKQIDIGRSLTLADLKAYLTLHKLREGSGIQFTPSGDINLDPLIAADVQEILDQISTTRGTVLYRGLLGWAALAPGAAGNFLKTNGAGADPSWAAAGGGGGILYGAGPPATALGNVGDFYFDTTALDLYGPKAATTTTNGRFWAVVIDSCVSTQVPSCGELQVFNTAVALIAAASQGMIDNNVTYPTVRINDGNLANFAISNRSGQTPREIFWLDLTVASPDVQKLRFYRRNDSFGYTEAPVNVRLYAGATAPVAPWTPVTHRSATFNWGASHGAGVTFNDILTPQTNEVWPIALTT